MSFDTIKRDARRIWPEAASISVYPVTPIRLSKPFQSLGEGFEVCAYSNSDEVIGKLIGTSLTELEEKVLAAMPA